METFKDSLVPTVGIVGVFAMPVFFVWFALHFNSIYIYSAILT